MPYVYALIFSILVSPLETLAKCMDGLLFNAWASFHEALKTGALFAIVAILSSDTLIRSALLSDPVRNERRIACKLLHAGALVLLIISLLVFALLWEARSDDVATWVSMGALYFVGVAIIFTFVAIWLDNQGRKAVNRHSAELRHNAGRPKSTRS
jgi:Kef-type K+ transport system membrane component KefB